MTTNAYSRLTFDDFYTDDHTSLARRSRHFADKNYDLIQTLNSIRVEGILEKSTTFKRSSWQDLTEYLKLTDTRLEEIKDVFRRLKKGIEECKLDDTDDAKSWREDKITKLCSTYTERFVDLTSFREIFVRRKSRLER